VLRRDVGRLPRRSRSARIPPSFDLADEQALPIVRFFHRLNRPLLADLHARDREFVDGHAIACSATHHVEPQVFEAPPPVLARPSTAPSSDCHVTSFIHAPLRVVFTRSGSAHLAGSSRERLTGETAGS